MRGPRRQKPFLASVLFVLLCNLCLAQEIREVVFHTEPPGAKIYRTDGGGIVGKSGQKIHLSIWKRGHQTFRFEKDGFKPLLFDVDRLVADGGRIPAEGTLRLEPDTRSMAVREWLRRNQVVVIPTLVILFVGAALAFRRVRADARKVAAAQQREKRLSPYKADTDDSNMHRVLGSWKLVEEAGRGGMSVVYKALPNDTLDASQMVAVKVLSRHALDDKEFLARFRREVLVCRSLSHPNIVQLYDWGEDRKRTYIVMEWLEGSTLKEVVQERLDPEEALVYLEPLFRAVAFAHSQGVVHRDLKPGNVMLTDKGLLKVVDFGLARAENTDTITVTGDALGTPAYMAPEQIKAREITGATDQYALGILTYKMLTGRLPFEATEALPLIMSHLTDEPSPPSEVCSELSERVDEVLLRMLAKEPEDRYEDLKVAFEHLRLALVE
jgi:predicted Ser/Thr protein kinase